MNLKPRSYPGAAWLVCSCIARSYSATWGDRKKSDFEDQFCPGTLSKPGRDETSETLILSNDLASTIWMAGGGAFKKTLRRARAGGVSKYFGRVENGRVEPGSPAGRRSVWCRAVFSARQSELLRACDSACMFAVGCTPNFFHAEKRVTRRGAIFAGIVAVFLRCSARWPVKACSILRCARRRCVHWYMPWREQPGLRH